MTLKENILIFILVVVALVVVGGVVFYIFGTKQSGEVASPGNQAVYVNPVFKVSLSYPASWEPQGDFGENEIPSRFAGPGGFFAVDAVGGGGLTIEEVIVALAQNDLKSFGSKPEISKFRAGEREGRIIRPSNDQTPETKGQSAVLLSYPKPVQIGEDSYHFFLLQADKEHIEPIGRSINLLADDLKATEAIKGTVLEVLQNKKIIAIELGEEGTADIVLHPATRILGEGGKPVTLSAVKPGIGVSARGEFIKPDSFLAAVVEITRIPNILVHSPRHDEEIFSPLTLRGEARVFEGAFAYRLNDGDAGVLFEGHGMTNAPDAGLFGSFEESIVFPKPKSDGGILEVFQYSAKDGSEIDKVIVPVRFGNPDTVSVKVFFSNSKLDPNAADCAKVYAVSRPISRTPAVARAALQELLNGVTASEAVQGYLTNIPKGAAVNSLTLSDGILRVDFNEALEREVGGSCRVTAIRSQIVETARQFPTVREVIISINGRAGNILQP